MLLPVSRSDQWQHRWDGRPQQSVERLSATAAGAVTGPTRLSRRPGTGRIDRKTCKLVENPALALIVASKLKQRWSPEQIAGWLKKTYPEDENYQVSHEIIYRSLYVQARGALKKELIKHLRTRRSDASFQAWQQER